MSNLALTEIDLAVTYSRNVVEVHSSAHQSHR